MRWLQFVRESIRRKFIFLIVSVMLLIASTVGITQYVLTSSMLQLDMEKYSMKMLEQANLNINRYFMEYKQAFLFISGSDEFYQWTRQQDKYTSTYLRLNNTIYQNSIQPFVMQHPEVISIALLNSYGYELLYNPKLPFRLGYSLADRMKSSPRTGGGPAIAVQRSSDYAGGPIVVLTMSEELNFYGKKTYIQMDISVNPLPQILDLMNEGNHNTHYIMDADGTIVAHPDEGVILTPVASALRQRLLADPSGAFLDERSEQFVVFASIPYTPGWKSVIELPYKEAARTIYTMRNFTVAVAAIGIGLTVLLIYLLSSSLTNRIVMLKRQLLNTKLGHIAPGPAVGGIDEIAQLGHSFNDMLSRLDASIDELAHTRAREQTAIFTAVQSQIHSHFLYNSLETINSMASLSGIKPIEQAVVSLSSMIRYSSRIRDVAVTLGDEIEHTRHYLNLTHIRFDSITYSYRIDRSVLTARCPKLILQPVVENAVKHNLEKLGRPVHIDITVRSRFGRYALIRICDNGAGIPPAELPALIGKVQSGDVDIPQGDRSIGLENVAYRIKRYYDGYGLKAKLVIGNRRFGSGVSVYIIVPIVTS